jgi:membrane protease YdiL (CAAX protease family)
MPRRWSTIFAILLVEAFVLVLRAMWEVRLLRDGHDPAFAGDVSYLVVPPLLALMLTPVLRQHRDVLARLFDPRRITFGVALSGFAVGALSRLAWWCMVILRGAAGADVAGRPGEFAVDWACPSPAPLLLALLIWICLVPVVEETLARGLIQGLLEYRGRNFAIAASAVLFALYHVPGTIPMALLMGIVFAFLRANSGNLWPGIAAHAAYDGMTIADWRCLHMHWQPGAGGPRLLTLAVPALGALVLLTAAIVSLVAGVRPGPRKAARTVDTSKGVGHPFDDV